MMTFEILTIIVLLNVVATIALWRRAARRPEKLKKKFRNLLWHSQPITPKHQPPPPLKKGKWGVDEEEIQFFSDFEDFANVVNWWLADEHNQRPWRLQELPESRLLSLGDPDSPTYGRTYAVFHNQARLGKIEIRWDSEYSTANPRVTVHIELDWVRLLPFGTIRSFLVDIALHISKYRSGTVEYVETNQEIDLALTDVLWETQEISEFGTENEPGYGRIEVQLSGLASYYLWRRQWLRERGKLAPG